ncbi:hypothetical protein [Sediminibacterium sp.]|uniref:hypothetical protein n=1 Tax=Sediminibacterium sp. TaxID=1917865 RepID=UPI003F7040CC
MKLKFLLIFILSLSCYLLEAQGTKQTYSAPNLKEVIKRAKTAAILPFNVTISYKKMPKSVTVENIKEDEKKEGPQMQQGMYTYMLRKMDDYTVSFQDVDRTNALLKKAGIYDNYNEILPDSICKILGVDIVIKSNWNYSKTGSEAGAIASALLLGFAKGTGSGQLIMQIYDGKTGDVIWRMAKEMDEGTFSSANELMERMMRKVGRNFPFDK